MLDLSFKGFPMGNSVKTKKGFIWTKFNDDTWLDRTTGIMWLPEENGKYNHYQAMELQTEEKRLPTKEEFEEAENHGIREILNTHGRCFWSSSAYSGNPADDAWVFNGYSGHVYYVGVRYYSGSVRMVATK